MLIIVAVLLTLILIVLTLSYLEQTGRAHRISKALRRKFKK